MYFFLNCSYYNHEWLSEDRELPHEDRELTTKRKKCFKKLFPYADERSAVNLEFANFSDGRDDFADTDALTDRGKMELVHGVNAPILQKDALNCLRNLVHLHAVRGIGVHILSYIL